MQKKQQKRDNFKEVHPRPAAVILPVYKNVKMTLDCIESALPGILSVPLSRLVIINDASPDEEMRDALREIAKRWPNVVDLLSNRQNLGFVATVNRGMRLYLDYDIVLLNSDVILPTSWLERLRDDAYTSANIGTVTPFTNSTTICTFPEFLQENQIPFGLNTQAVDDVFSDQKLPCVEAPTGVGFCMYIRRIALTRFGYFNEERFGRGYGEENDFCQRVVKGGFLNLITPNLYVYHRGGANFGTDKAALIENAMKTIDELHPNYHADVQRFIASDPLRDARIRRFVKLIAKTKTPKILHLSHGLGGGVDQHIEELVQLSDGRAIPLLLLPKPDESRVEVRLGIKNTADSLFFNLPQHQDELLFFLRVCNVSLLHYHHTLRLNPILLKLPEILSVDHILTIHDFFLLNANPTLTDEKGVFPGFYSDYIFNPLFPLPDGISAAAWRDRHREMVETAKTVIFPSRSARKIFGDFYKISKSVAVYHSEVAREQAVPFRGISKRERYNIAVIGALSREKGADRLEEIALLAKKNLAALNFILIGYAYKSLREIETTGLYQRSQIQALLLEKQADVCFFPAQCPETFSYTLSYALESGLPIIAPNIGAFPERLAGREGVLIFDHLARPDDILRDIQFFIELCSRGAAPRASQLASDAVATGFYEEDYFTFAKIRPKLSTNGELSILVCPVLRERRRIREKILVFLWKMYSHPSMRWVDSLVPFKVRRAIKRMLSRRNIHEI
jgi:GT2 family glycosyltransferase/glycosyltransferase involved in cell wall biosynthesis